MGRKIGVDLHKNSFRVCYYQSDKNYDFETYCVSVKGLDHFKKGLKRRTSWQQNRQVIQVIFLERLKEKLNGYGWSIRCSLK